MTEFMRIDCLNPTDLKEEVTGTGKRIHLCVYPWTVQFSKKALTSGSGFHLGLMLFLNHPMVDNQDTCRHPWSLLSPEFKEEWGCPCTLIQISVTHS